jgi:hypothetical protein
MADALRFVPVTLRLRGLRRALLLLLTALVLVHTLGVLHRVVHAHGPISSNCSMSGPSLSQSVAGVTDESLVLDLQRLWGEHSNSAECQLFDQTCPDAWHTSALLLMPALPAARWMAASLQERFALAERFYAARGPPAWQ